MYKKLLAGLIMTMSAGAMFASAQGNLVERPGAEAVILKKLQASRPEITFGKPRPSPIEGLYQVQVTGGPLLYITPDGEKFIAGEMFAVEEGGFARVEDPYALAERKSLLASLNPDQTINFKPKGETKAVVYVFTDVDCGYCRLLHSQIHTYQDKGKTMPGYNDLGIEIRYLAYPRAGVPSPSADKLITAWCAKDKQKTLTAFKNQEFVNIALCNDNPVAADFQLGAEVGVNGTPAIWMPDGKLMPGYLPPADLAKALGI